MKRIISSSLLTIAALAVIVGGTGAFFSDTETSTGNVFTAGSIDLFINHTAASYNGEACEQNCTVETAAANLIDNGSFETPDINTNWEIVPSLPEWESNSAVEIHDTLLQSAEGDQHVELDGAGDTTLEQTFTTVPGQRYQLSFETSPRPNNQSAGSGVAYMLVEAVSPSGTALNTQTNIPTGQAAVNWTQTDVEFIAIDSETTVSFSLTGGVTGSGGLLDNVVIKPMECTNSQYQNTPGGYCELWESKNLADDSFFDFADVKPQDEGTNRISMTVEDNESYICLAVHNQENEEHTRNDAEEAAGDTTENEGELGDYLQVMGWYSDGYGNKSGVAFGPTTANNLESITYADSNTGTPVAPGETEYLELAWCLGELTDEGNGDFSCAGNVIDINQTQTDEFTADLQFYAVQTRNNEDFTCADADFGSDDDATASGIVVGADTETYTAPECNVTVNADGTADYASIQAAIDAEPAGTTICVADGEYNEFFVNKDDITIAGLTNPFTGTASVVPSGVGVSELALVTASGVTIQGLHFDGNGTIITANQFAGVQISPNGADVSDITITKNRFSDLVIEGSPNRSNKAIQWFTEANDPYTLIDSVFSHNVIEGVSSGQRGAYGIQTVGATDNLLITQNTIKGPVAGDWQAGIAIDGKATVTTDVAITRNDIQSPSGYSSVQVERDASGDDVRVNENNMQTLVHGGGGQLGSGSIDATSNWWGTSNPTNPVNIVGDSGTSDIDFNSPATGPYPTF